MKTCKFCQAEMDDEAMICPGCGKNQEEEAPEVTLEAPAEEGTQETSVTEEAPAEEAVPETVEAPSAEETPLSAEMKPGATPGKIALAVAAVVVLLAALIALVVMGLGGREAPAETVPSDGETAAVTETEETEPPTIPADGEKGTVTEKGTYSADDETAIAARDVVVANLGDIQLTNAELQSYYWMEVHSFLMQYYSYASYFGLDPAQSLDTQMAMGENMTWQQYFLQAALNNWQQIQAMAAEAKKAGLTITAEDQAQLEGMKDTLQANADSYGVTLEELLRSNLGPAATFQDYEKYQRDYRQGVPYFNAEVEKLKPTEADLEAFYAEHEEQYLEQGITKEGTLVDVRHILLQPEGGETGENGQTTYSEEEWEACRAAAQEILDGFLAGEKTEEGFAALAGEHSADPGSQGSGGLYTDVYQGQMVPEFDAWCFDAGRAYGDTGLVKTDYGYHIMYFVDSKLMWKQYAESDWVNEKTGDLLDGLAEAYPLTVDYGKIVLGELSEVEAN